MATTQKNKTNNPFWDWLKKSWDTILKILGAITGIFVFGFQIGSYYEGQKFELAKMKLEMQCNTEKQALENKFREDQLKETKATIDGLTQLLNKSKSPK